MVGLDFSAVLMLADQLGAPLDLVADLLPDIEPFVVLAHHPDAEGPAQGDNE